jgi:hypothetical protein
VPAELTNVDETSANTETCRHMGTSKAVLVDLVPAASVLPNLGKDDILHAGPPLESWDLACGALRGAVIGALLHEGRAGDAAEAEELASDGAVRLVSASDYGVMATYGGVITPSTHVFVVENTSGGTRAYAAINEGRGKALRYGSHDGDALTRYVWLESTFAAVLGTAIRNCGGIDLFHILTQALHMGDDGHSRQKAASALFTNAISPDIVITCADTDTASSVIKFMAGNEIFHLPLTMAAAKATMISVEGISGSSVVTAMAANGVDWGIKVSGCGDRWFTAPVPMIQGTYFEGFSSEDASPVIGDSEIAETFGLGAFALSGAPALGRFMGGSAEAARAMAVEMYEITVSEHPRFKIPALEYRGTPMGIDLRRVLETGIAPVFNTGIAHAEPGVGQIGAGFGRVPMACFEAASVALADSA